MLIIYINFNKKNKNVDLHITSRKGWYVICQSTINIIKSKLFIFNFFNDLKIYILYIINNE